MDKQINHYPNHGRMAAEWPTVTLSNESRLRLADGKAYVLVDVLMHDGDPNVVGIGVVVDTHNLGGQWEHLTEGDCIQWSSLAYGDRATIDHHWHRVPVVGCAGYWATRTQTEHRMPRERRIAKKMVPSAGVRA